RFMRGTFISINVTLKCVSVEPVMEVNSSSDTKFERGETVTLHCTSRCSFHQLEVSWFKDGSILSGSGTALQIGPLTASDSGNYTCTLRANMNSLSAPFSLQLEGGRFPHFPLSQLIKSGGLVKQS
uniref:Ig-like domain-containing protein n=1 Tax=Stegastes partitus TaxID=144197 RepID=A0A3B4ZCZ8_9TELE